MDYSALEGTDLADVQALNKAFLRCLRGDGPGQVLREQLPHPLQAAARGLSDLQVERLAVSPFLLMSLAEFDDAYWQRLLADDSTADLFDARPGRSDEAGRIAAATLGFLWQLARRNAYAARLISGASLNWCDQLAACTLWRVTQQAADRDDLLRPRLGGNEPFWRRLLCAGLSSEPDVRGAAHLCALQTVLTESQSAAGPRVAAAACHAQVPTLRVAEQRRRP